ncbi:hypothetical protein ACFVHR_19420 [Streptomyces sp. NPDC127168]|uniref:hypothetical protein n=1 Tax=unclassified Streptomyces TaxID=2593676 RepID=UPI00363669AD
MNGIALTLRALHDGEQQLADDLVTVAERHRAEHEVHHVATDLAAWSLAHVRRLAEAAAQRDAELKGPADPSYSVFATRRAKEPEVLVHRPAPGLLLLRDLRELHVSAAENSLHWEMLAQAAQASRDPDLLQLVSDCHPQTLRQMRWTNTMIKNLAPQILTSL